MPRKRSKKKSPSFRIVAPEHDEPILEPLAGPDVPFACLAALDLPSEPRLQALYFAQNGSAVVYNGQDFKTIPVDDALDLSVWLEDQGVFVMDMGDWLVLDVTSGAGYFLSPEVARLTVESQFGQEDSVPLESLFDEEEMP
jgi:hypothetical protein